MGGIAPVMVDLAGTALMPEEHARLRDPRVGGVILFARNYAHPAQLRALIAELRALRPQPLLVAVDQEGGRVQRFREGFSQLPAPAELGRLYRQDPLRAGSAARDLGVVLAWELHRCGVDFSFAPVLDLDHGRSAVIGTRALSGDPEAVTLLAGQQLLGLSLAGCAGVGKHFPGHGHVAADSHAELPEDDRPLSVIGAADLLPFARLAARLGGVMPAHVRFPRCAEEPAGFSAFWLQTILRERLGFRGAIFSDDLSMGGAQGAGTPAARARAAFAAGCDMVLLCNDPESADALLADLGRPPVSIESTRRLDELRSGPPMSGIEQAYRHAQGRLDALGLEGWRAAG